METFDVGFILNSILLGLGLAMDAFSVSLANGLSEPQMKASRMLGMAGIFAGFQGVMPLIGWACIHTIAKAFDAFKYFIPWIALVMLLYIGGKMLKDGLKEIRDNKDGISDDMTRMTCTGNVCRISMGTLLLQGIATSIDAMSVGFSIAEYAFFMAVISALIIAFITLGVCFIGIAIGKKFGTRLAGKASILGGVILIAIGIEIWAKGVFA